MESSVSKAMPADFQEPTLRDFFAAAALIGLAPRTEWATIEDLSDLANDCYVIADAMLEYRKEDA